MIGITEYDLNNNKKEIITKICNSVIYGFNEYIITIYNKNYKNILSVIFNYNLFILAKLYNNYYILYSNTKLDCINTKCITKNNKLLNTKLHKIIFDGDKYILPNNLNKT